MSQQNQTQVSAGLLKVCTFVGTVGAALSVVSDLPFKEMPEDVANFISSIGDIALDISLGLVLLFMVKKIKQSSEKKPSPLVFSILIGTLLLSLIEGLSTFGEVGADNTFSYVSIFLFVGMMIVTGIVCLLEPATKKIGIWMIGVIVGALLAGMIADSVHDTNKLTLLLTMGIFGAPVNMLFNAMKNYLIGEESPELVTK